MTFHLAATLVQMASQMWDETAFLIYQLGSARELQGV